MCVSLSLSLRIGASSSLIRNNEEALHKFTSAGGADALIAAAAQLTATQGGASRARTKAMHLVRHIASESEEVRTALRGGSTAELPEKLIRLVRAGLSSDNVNEKEAALMLITSLASEICAAPGADLVRNALKDLRESSDDNDEDFVAMVTAASTALGS